MRIAWLVVVLGSGGCLDVLGPETGPPLQAACTAEDSDPTTPVRFGPDLRNGVFERSCVRCHTAGGATPIGLQVGGLDLSSAASLRAGGVESGEAIVVPGDPCASVLVQKINAAPPFGARMPLDGPPYLGERDRQLVADWIAEGAADD